MIPPLPVNVQLPMNAVRLMKDRGGSSRDSPSSERRSTSKARGEGRDWATIPAPGGTEQCADLQSDTPEFRSRLDSTPAGQPLHATSQNLRDPIRKMGLTCHPPRIDGEDGVRGRQEHPL